MHEKFVLHRDIKPDNFLMGLGAGANVVHVIDFGLSRPYRHVQTREHVAMRQHSSLTGTARYASVNAMRALEHGRRDDMESLGYVWIYLLRGQLPWQGLTAENQQEKLRRILEMKASASPGELCTGLPREFATYLEIVRELAFEDEPPYAAIREMFRELFMRLQFVFDYVYDWTETRTRNESEKLRSLTPKLVTTQPLSHAVSPRPKVTPSRLVKSLLHKVAPVPTGAAPLATAAPPSPKRQGRFALSSSLRVQIPRPIFRVTGERIKATGP
jgi:serine/threonine protein kinase